MKIHARVVIGFTVAVTVAAAATSFAQPVITAQPTNQIVFAGDNAAFGVTVSGGGPFAYQWQFNGTNLPNNVITTIAGGGPYSYPTFGDGGLATNASLNNPAGVAVDNQGNVFIADSFNNRVRRVGINGIITIVAGTNGYGYSGDGSMATNAELSTPAGLATDASGNLLIADRGNNRVRMVVPNGYIFTVAGGGTGGDHGPATEASLNSPTGVAVDDSGNLFIADRNNNRVREVIYGIITTVAGGGSSGLGDGGLATKAQLNEPCGVAVDNAGDLFIVDYGNNRIRKVATNGIITTVVGGGKGGGSDGIGDGGTATNATLSGPMGMAVDTAGDLFILDAFNGRIRELGTNGIITTVAGNGDWKYAGDGGAATNASFWFYNNDYDSGVAVDTVGNLYVGDTYNNRVREAGFGGYPVLTLNNTTAGNMGNYQVIISNSSGSVTSSVATLTFISPPLISSIAGGAGGSLTLNLITTTNVSSRIYAATNLTPPVNWLPIYTNLVGGAWQFNDPNAPNRPMQFYRVSTP